MVFYVLNDRCLRVSELDNHEVGLVALDEEPLTWGTNIIMFHVYFLTVSMFILIAYASCWCQISFVSVKYFEIMFNLYLNLLLIICGFWMMS